MGFLQEVADTYLATHAAGRVIAAKFAVYTTTRVMFGVVLAITAVIATAVAITANGGSLDLSNSDLCAPSPPSGRLGALIRKLAAAIASALAWIALVEG